ncbi:MAG: hypothetical protein Q4F41_08855 [Eubacteriales bacterium]|nr:hypothetical protein [Eubacteriales bacterium]
MKKNSVWDSIAMMSGGRVTGLGSHQVDLDKIYQSLSKAGRELSGAKKKEKAKDWAEEAVLEAEEAEEMYVQEELNFDFEEKKRPRMEAVPARPKPERMAYVQTRSCFGQEELSPEMLQKAMVWAEILGEPVAKKRRRRRSY